MKIVSTLLFLLFTSFIVAQNTDPQLDTLQVELNPTLIQSKIKGAPVYVEGNNRLSTKLISLPTLNGQQETFYVYETISMEEALYLAFPQIRSYILVNTLNSNYKGRLSTGPKHIRVMTKHDKHYEFLEPVKNESTYKLYKGVSGYESFSCGADDVDIQLKDKVKNRSAQSTFSNGSTIRNYRIAVAATGEFYQEHGNTNTAVLAQINNYINLLNDIFEDELAVHFNLIANNTAILFPDPATDGIDPTDSNTQLTTSQTVINATIGAANYDIGHTFYAIPPPPPPFAACCSTSGVASLGIVCEDSFKARGWTGASGGSSDALFMGTFAHEIGHQFGAHHSYYGTASNCVQRSPGNGYEPGSGNSLMSYEGICSSHNITPEVSTFYFHNHSLEQMVNEMNSKSCHTTATPSNSGPITTVPANKTIPRDTPFELEGSATDADGDIIYYNWEQFDTDNLVSPNGDPNAAATSTTAPLFRSFDPSTSGNIRTFPIISDIVNNTQTLGEILPSVSRNMTFRLTSRDFATGAGAISCGEVNLTVDATIGPFDVTSQASATTWVANGTNTTTVTWDVAGTSTLCSNVDILFSTDGGTTFPFTLASNVANNGSHTFTIPSYPTFVGRIKVKCSDNYFFDINLGDITLESSCDAVSATFSPDTDITAIEGSSGLNLSLSPDFGTSIGDFTGTLTTTDPTTNISRFSSAGPCEVFGNVNRYHTYNMEVAVSESYTFTLGGTTPFGTIMRVYKNSFNPGSPCSNMLVSSYQASNAVQSSISVTLNPGLQYVFVVSSFSSTLPTLPASYTITHTGTIYDDTPPPGATFNYTYIAVNQSSGTIAAESTNSNFTSLTPGTYSVYGVSHENTTNVNSYIGSTFASFQTDASLLVICAAISLNDITLIIQSNSNCPTNYAGANALSGPISGTQDYETDGEIESSQIIQAGATIDFDSGTSIKLEAPFEVPSSATMHAFIDGCGGTAIQEKEESENK